MTQRTRTSKALEAKAGQGGEGNLLFSSGGFWFLGLGGFRFALFFVLLWVLFFAFCMCSSTRRCEGIALYDTLFKDKET